MRFLCSLLILTTIASGCGRILPPFAPEDLAPRPVQSIEVVALADGIQFSWVAPEEDIRGEELRSLDYYQIERKVIAEPSDVIDETISYEEVGLVPDRYFAQLQAKQEELVEKRLPKRKAVVEESFKKHQFIDRSLMNGTRYLYRISGVNQGNESGAVDSYVDVEFAGLNSVVTIASDLEDVEETPLEADVDLEVAE